MTEKKMTVDQCDGCPGSCCRGIEEQVKKPRTIQEVADVRWQLHFTHIQFFIRSRRWYRHIVSPCCYLDENSFCAIYEERPQVCRDHMPPSCEHYHPIWDTVFVTPEDLDRWVVKEERRKKRAKAKRAKG